MIPLFRMIRAGIAVVIGPPSQRLSLLHVDDLASAIVAWLGNGEQCYGGIYSLDDGKTGGYDWPAIVEACRHRRTVATIAIPRLALLGWDGGGIGSVDRETANWDPPASNCGREPLGVVQNQLR